MKFSTITAVLAAFLMTSIFAEDARPPVGVLEFIAKGVAKTEAEIVEELFRTELVRCQRFNVLDRGNMDTILNEQAFQQSGCTDQSCAVEIGKMLNMKYMLYGTLMKMGDTYYITVGMVSIETSRIVQTARQSFSDIDKVAGAMTELIKKLTSSLPGSGGEYVLKKKKKRKKLEPAVYLGGALSVGLSGVAINVLGFRDKARAEDLQAAYPDGVPTSYQPLVDNTTSSGTAKRITGYMCYAVSGALLITGITRVAEAKAAAAKKKKTALLVPTGDGVRAVFAMEF